MSDHTQGPWIVDRSGDGRTGTIIRGGDMYPGATHLPIIAKMANKSVANAQLVAAAPELFEALEALLYDRSDVGNIPQERWESARAVYLKARDGK